MSGDQGVRPAEHYVFGTGSDAHVLVPARVAAVLNGRGLDKLRISIRGADPLVDAVLLALSIAGTGWRASAYGTTVRNLPEPAALSPWLTSTEVADRLYISDRAVRAACQAGRLTATREGGRWRISREAMEHYRAALDNRAA